MLLCPETLPKLARICTGVDSPSERLPIAQEQSIPAHEASPVFPAAIVFDRSVGRTRKVL